MKFRRVISAMLFISIMLSLSTMAFAVETPQEGITDEIKDKMLQTLSFIEVEKEYYNMGAVDFHAVSIGKKLPVYRVEGDRLVDADVQFYPVLHNGKLVNVFLVCDCDGEVFAQLSADFVEPFNSYVNDEAIAFVYDDTGLYLYVNDELILLLKAESTYYTYEDQIRHQEFLKENNIPDDSVYFARESKEDFVANVSEQILSSLNTESLTNDIVLDISHNIEPYATGGSVYLAVDILRQPENGYGHHSCWSMCIASIANYIFKKTGTNKWKYTDIMQMFTSGADQGMWMEDVIYNFNKYFNAGYSYGYTKKIAPVTVYNQLKNGYPIYADFEHMQAGHGMVIRGVDTNKREISVMNPSPTTTTYTTGGFIADNEVRIISVDTGKLYTLRSYGFHL